MQRFAHDGVDIAFLDEGEGAPIVLVHGFASTAQVNWVYPGWVATLTGAGRRVIALDNRGHGSSSKLRDPAAYHSARMAEDVRALLDHLDLGRADVMGYSMGARIAAFFALAHPQRLRRAVFGGLGMHLVDGVGLPESIAAALDAPSLADVHDPMGRTFRTFAEQTKSDLTALAACIRGSRQNSDARAGRGDRRAGAGGSRHQGYGCGLRAGAGGFAPGGAGARCAGAGPHARGGGQSVQAGRAGLPGGVAVRRSPRRTMPARTKFQRERKKIPGRQATRARTSVAREGSIAVFEPERKWCHADSFLYRDVVVGTGRCVLCRRASRKRARVVIQELERAS